MSYWRLTNTLRAHVEDLKNNQEIIMKTNDTTWILQFDGQDCEYHLSCINLKRRVLACIHVIAEYPEACFQYRKIFSNKFLVHSFISYDVRAIEISFFEEKRDIIDTRENDDREQFESIADSDRNKELENKYEQLSNDLSSFWQRKILTDVDIQCGSEVFKAHKAILAARSPFFAAMFQSPMKESQANVVEIKITKPRIFQIVLSYLYSGRKPVIEDTGTAFEVLMAADFFNIPSLKLICTCFLRSAMSVYNAVSFLVFTDLYDPVFKKDVVQFICDHFDRVIDTEEWVNLERRNPFLAMKVMIEKIKLNLRKQQIEL